MIPAHGQRGSMKSVLSPVVHATFRETSAGGRLDFDQEVDALIRMGGEDVDLHAGDPLVSSEDPISLASEEPRRSLLSPSTHGEMTGPCGVSPPSWIGNPGDRGEKLSESGPPSIQPPDGAGSGVSRSATTGTS